MEVEHVADDGDRCRLVEHLLILTPLLDDGDHGVIGAVEERVDPNRPFFGGAFKANDGGERLENDLFLLLGEPLHEHLALPQHLLDVRPVLHAVDVLRHHERPAAVSRQLEEGVAGHVLHAGVRFVHELEVLGDDGAEELEVRLEEAGELLDDVHETARDDRLVVLRGLRGDQAQQVHDGGHEKPPLLRLRQHAAEGADGPDERLQRGAEGVVGLLLHLESEGGGSAPAGPARA